MKKDIMKRTLAGMTAVLTAASYAPAFAVNADTESTGGGSGVVSNQEVYPDNLNDLYNEAHDWFIKNYTALDEKLGADLEMALEDANGFLGWLKDMDEQQAADMLESEGSFYYNELLDAYKAAKDSLVEIVIEYTKVEAKDPTCTEDGNIEYFTGSDGNIYIEGENGAKVQTTLDAVTVAAHHTWGEPTWHWFGTEGASAFFKCTADGCGKTETIAADVTTEVVNPTCEKDGKVIYTATVELDGEEYTDTQEFPIEKLGHKWGTPTYTEGENEKGELTVTATRVCANDKDKDHVETETVVASYEVTKAPTVREKGTGVYTATFENEAFEDWTKTVEIAAIDPEYNEATYVWSEDYSEVTATATCKNGDAQDTVTETVKTTSEVTKNPTCEAKGETTYTTEAFKNKLFVEQTRTVENVDALGHKYTTNVEWVWDKDNKATAKFACKECDHVEEVKATITEKVTLKPTCTESGAATLTATVVFEGRTYTDNKDVEVAPTGHNYEVTWFWKDDNTAVAYFRCADCGDEKAVLAKVTPETTTATCTEEGKTTYTAVATIDGKDYTDSKDVAIAKLPHAFEVKGYEWTATDDGYKCTATRKCADCGLEEYETVEATYSVTKKPTVKAQGVGTYTATFSGEDFEVQTKEVPIEKLAPDYADASYTWSEDFSEVTATRECLNGDPDDAVTETVKTTREVTKAASCTAKGETTYTAKFENDLFATQEKTLDNIDMIDHSYGTPIWSWTPVANGYTAKLAIVCSVCGKTEGSDAVVTSEKKDDKILYTAKASIDGVEYTSTLVANVANIQQNPVVSYEKGDEAVKLTWDAVDGAEKYGVLGFINGKWQMITESYKTYYVLENLKAGEEYKVAVICKFNGKWYNDLSNAITVTPNEPAALPFPTITNIDYNEEYHQFRLNWTAVEGAENYGVAVYLAGKWKIQTQSIPATTTSFTSPKLKAGQTYKMLVAAKVNGKWDLTAMTSRAFTVTVK